MARYRADSEMKYKFCCCLHVKHGAFVFGFLVLLLHLVSVFMMSTDSILVHQHMNDAVDYIWISNETEVVSGEEDGTEVLGDDYFDDGTYYFFTKDSKGPMKYKMDKPLAMLICWCVVMVTMMLMYGITKERPSYVLPFFCLQLFDFFIISLFVMALFSYSPNLRPLIEKAENLPYKDKMLAMDDTSLTLVVNGVAFVVVLGKLYLVWIIWACYRYLIDITLEKGSPLSRGSTSRTPSSESGAAEEELIIEGEPMLLPPKYEEAMRCELNRVEEAQSGGNVEEDQPVEEGEGEGEEGRTQETETPPEYRA